MPDADAEPEPLADADPEPLADADADAEPEAEPEPEAEAEPLTLADSEDSPISRTSDPSSLPVHAAPSTATAAAATMAIPSRRLIRGMCLSFLFAVGNLDDLVPA